MNVVRSKRRVAGLGAALVAVVGLTLFVVLPALGSNPGDRVPPPAVPSGLVPVDMPLGGNGTCSNLFTSAVSKLPNLHEYDNVNPGTATGLSSGNGDGVTFSTTLSGSSKSQVLQLGSTKAAIAGIGIKGGSESTVYDYTGLNFTPGVAQGFVTSDGNLHAPAAKFTVSGGTENPSQWYGISQMTVCYRVLAPISGAVFNDANGTGLPAGQSGLDGVVVTIVDNTTGGHTTVTTANGGVFSSPQPVGDSYTVCSASPGSALSAVGAGVGGSLPGRPEGLQHHGWRWHVDHQLLRVPAARLGRRHGLQRRQPGSGERHGRLAALGLERHALRRRAAAVDDVQPGRVVQAQRARFRRPRTTRCAKRRRAAPGLRTCPFPRPRAYAVRERMSC